MVGGDIPAYDGLSTDLFDVEQTDFKTKFSPPSYSVNSKIPFPLIFLQIGKTDWLGDRKTFIFGNETSTSIIHLVFLFTSYSFNKLITTIVYKSHGRLPLDI